jgi:soluble lytic murein transglycosylase-like protein
MTLSPRGPEAIRARIAEIQSRMAAIQPPSPEPEPILPEPPVPGAPQPRPLPSFGQMLGSQMAEPEVLTPLNPFAPMTGVAGARPGEAELRTMAAAAAQRHGLDPALFQSLVQQESAFDPSAKSRAGALGLSQLMPSTARMLGVSDPLDPYQNLDGGARYLAQMMKEFGGDTSLALAAYNAGPGAVRRHGGIPPFRETQDYVRKILASAGGAS